MGSKYIDDKWIGKKFGRLTVIDILGHNEKGKIMWLMRCDCGNVRSVCVNNIINGHSTSCGCYVRELFLNSITKHGKYHTRMYMVWRNIIERCTPGTVQAKHYADRGIRLCDEWKDFFAFEKWAMENGYSDKLSIERINVDGDYCPDNCIWIDRKFQTRNQTTTHWVEWKGKRMSLAEACEIEGMPYKQVFARVKYCGWTLEDALTKPIRSVRGAARKRCQQDG